MKVIDLLNKIANNEKIPQLVSYEGKTYHIDELEHFYVNDNRKALLEYIFDYLNDFDALMTEVEIIGEDKKIEKINKIVPSSNWAITDKSKNVEDRLEIIRKRLYDNELYMLEICNSFNEIIDMINKD